MSTATEVATRTDPFVRYGFVLGGVLLGYVLFDRAFAYLHLPGVPLFVGELLLLLGAAAALRSTGVFVRSVAAEPVLALLVAFVLWGAVRTLPGVPTYGLDAVRDAALWYYALFALLACAAVAVNPGLPHLLAAQLARWSPLILVWLAASVILGPWADRVPRVPFSDVSMLSHKPGSAATAAMLVLAVLWLVPGQEPRKGRVPLSFLALTVIALVATQNRGSLLGIVLAGTVALAFLADRVRVVSWMSAAVGITLTLMLLLSIKVPFPGVQGRDYSAQQFVANVVSLTGRETGGNLGGTVDGRKELWSRVLAKQVSEHRVLSGAGFGPNLAAEVGVFDDGEDSLRNPHNTHISVVARMGAFGMLLWVGLWGAWYWRMIGAARRLRHTARHADAQLGGVCLAVATTVLVASVFDPQLEGPQVAILLWTIVGMGLAVTGRRA
ncbi:O-antigen ligase family protein [Nocardioides sediminis]|uniref:O-antigen ligase family protein n=1 Tax=Nocardioides sediminis TaxID=433648 RepID=UPI00131EDA85|nr:O-antigen ligase family protein [Nocardioides sediminis]